MPVLCSRNFMTSQMMSSKLPVIQSISRCLKSWDAYVGIVRLQRGLGRIDVGTKATARKPVNVGSPPIKSKPETPGTATSARF